MYKITPEDIRIINQIYSACMNSKYGSSCKGRITYAGDSYLASFQDTVELLRNTAEKFVRNNLAYEFPDLTTASPEVINMVAFFIPYVLSKTNKLTEVICVPDMTSKKERVLYIMFTYNGSPVCTYGLFRDKAEGYCFMRRIAYVTSAGMRPIINHIEKTMSKAK